MLLVCVTHVLDHFIRERSRLCSVPDKSKGPPCIRAGLWVPANAGGRLKPRWPLDHVEHTDGGDKNDHAKADGYEFF